MIIHSFNDQLSDALVDELTKTIKVDKFLYPPGHPFPIYSSFEELLNPHFTPNVESYYNDKVREILDHVGLLDRTVVNVSKWCQIYNKSLGGSHDTHTHFSGSELLSCVHFVRTPQDQKCFYFMVKGEKYYPDTQHTGDFIVFPSWASHGADPVNSDDDRIIVSTNIDCRLYKELPNSDKSFVCSKKMRKDKLHKVWSMETL